jgi:hypothetical protein
MWKQKKKFKRMFSQFGGKVGDFSVAKAVKEC